jgi:hypothetical protein
MDRLLVVARQSDGEQAFERLAFPKDGAPEHRTCRPPASPFGMGKSTLAQLRSLSEGPIPSTGGDASLHMGPICGRDHRPFRPMSPAIAEATGSDDVACAVPAAVGSRHQMLGGAVPPTRQSGLAAHQAPTIVAATALPLECPAPQPGQCPIVHHAHPVAPTHRAKASTDMQRGACRLPHWAALAGTGPRHEAQPRLVHDDPMVSSQERQDLPGNRRLPPDRLSASEVLSHCAWHMGRHAGPGKCLPWHVALLRPGCRERSRADALSPPCGVHPSCIVFHARRRGAALEHCRIRDARPLQCRNR